MQRSRNCHNDYSPAPQVFGPAEANRRGLGIFTECPRGLLNDHPDVLVYWNLYAACRHFKALPSHGGIGDQDAKTMQALMSIASALSGVDAAVYDSINNKRKTMK